MTGAERIAAERQRQVEVEGYDASHDQGHHDELAAAAATYALPRRYHHPSSPRRRHAVAVAVGASLLEA
jgi:hypothetical protein